MINHDQFFSFPSLSMSIADAHSLMDKHLNGFHVGADLNEAHEILHQNNDLLIKHDAIKRFRTEEHPLQFPKKGARKELADDFKIRPSYRNKRVPTAFFEQPHTGAEWDVAIRDTQQAALPRDSKYTELSEELVHQFNEKLFEKTFPTRGREIADNIQVLLRQSAETLARGAFDMTLKPDERSEQIRRGFKMFDNMKLTTAHKLQGEKGAKRHIEMEALAGVDFFASTIVNEFSHKNGPSTHFVSSYFKDKTYFVEAITHLKKNRSHSERYDIADLDFANEKDARDAISGMVQLTTHVTHDTPLPSFSQRLLSSIIEKIGVLRRVVVPDDQKPKDAKKDSWIIAIIKFVLSLFLISGSWYTVYSYASDFFDPTKNTQVIISEAEKMTQDIKNDIEMTDTNQKQINDLIEEQHNILYNSRSAKLITDFSKAQEDIQQYMTNAVTLDASVDKISIIKSQQTFINEIVTMTIESYQEIPDSEDLKDAATRLHKVHDEYTVALEKNDFEIMYTRMDELLRLTGGAFLSKGIMGDLKNIILKAKQFIVTIEELTQKKVDWQKYFKSLTTISDNANAAIEKLRLAGNETPIYTGIFRFLAEHNVAQYWTSEKNWFGTHGVGNTFMSIFEQLGLDAFRQIECMWTRVLRDFANISGDSETSFNTKILSYGHTLLAFGVNGSLRALNNSYISWIVRFWAWGSTKTLQSLVLLSKQATRDLYLIMTGEPDIYVPVEEWISPYEFSYNFEEEAIVRFEKSWGRVFNFIYDSLGVFPSAIKTMFNYIDTLQTIANYTTIVLQISITNIFQAIFQGVHVAIGTIGLLGIFLYLAYRFKGYNFIRHIVNFFVQHPNFRMPAIFLAQLITGWLISYGFKIFENDYFFPLDDEANAMLRDGGPFRAFLVKLVPPMPVV